MLAQTQGMLTQAKGLPAQRYTAPHAIVPQIGQSQVLQLPALPPTTQSLLSMGTLVSERKVSREEMIQTERLIVAAPRRAGAQTCLENLCVPVQQNIPRANNCGRFEARVVEQAEVLCDFKAGNEASHGTFPYSRMRFYMDGVPMMWQTSLHMLAGDSSDAHDFRELHVNVFAGDTLHPYKDFFLGMQSGHVGLLANDHL